MISEASASRMEMPLRESAKSTIQRSASAFWRSLGISIGTWYVAPPTRRLRLDARLGVVHRALQNLDRIARRVLLRNGVKRAVHNPLRRALLAADHHRV